MSGYNYRGERPTASAYVPTYGPDPAAKFAYFRKAEAAINGGPAPFYAPPRALKPIRPRLDVPACGTNSGYARHLRQKEAPCRPCLDARGNYQREYRSRRKDAA